MQQIDVIRSVWESLEDEIYRKDICHYRGIGRWENDAIWKAIGEKSKNRIAYLWRALGRKKDKMQNLRILEWGPGGGSNVYGLRGIASYYAGIDISQKNLEESLRVITEEGYNDLFHGYLLANTPQDAVADIANIDIFLSTAVFQHFPSKEYGIEVLKAIRSTLCEKACGFIQIRYDNGNIKYKGVTNLGEYQKKYITACSYQIDEFWNILIECGFKPVFVREIRTRNNYATFYVSL